VVCMHCWCPLSASRLNTPHASPFGYGALSLHAVAPNARSTPQLNGVIKHVIEDGTTLVGRFSPGSGNGVGCTSASASTAKYDYYIMLSGLSIQVCAAEYNCLHGPFGGRRLEGITQYDFARTLPSLTQTLALILAIGDTPFSVFSNKPVFSFFQVTLSCTTTTTTPPPCFRQSICSLCARRTSSWSVLLATRTCVVCTQTFTGLYLHMLIRIFLCHKRAPVHPFF